MLKRITFGQYRPGNSIVHRIDPRLKLIYVFLLSLLLLRINSPVQILNFSFFVIVIVMLSKIGSKTFARGLRPFTTLFLFIILMYLIFARDKLTEGFVVIWRFFLLLCISLVLTFTTAPSDLVTAIEKLAKPMKIIGIRPRNIAVAISITIRFVPVMFINLEKLREAMQSRLANFRKMKHMKILVLGLLERMLKSASTVSDAMQSRLYNEDAESSKELKMKAADYVSIVLITAAAALAY